MSDEDSLVITFVSLYIKNVNQQSPGCLRICLPVLIEGSIWLKYGDSVAANHRDTV